MNRVYYSFLVLSCVAALFTFMPHGVQAQPVLSVVEVNLDGSPKTGQELTLSNPLDFDTLCLPPGAQVRRISIRNVGTAGSSVSVRPSQTDLLSLLLPTGRWVIRDSLGNGYNPFTVISQINDLLAGIEAGQRRDFRILYMNGTPGTLTPTLTLNTENPNIGSRVFRLRATSAVSAPNLTASIPAFYVAWYLPFPTPGVLQIKNWPGQGQSSKCMTDCEVTNIVLSGSPEFSLDAGVSFPFDILVNTSKNVLINFQPDITLTQYERRATAKIIYRDKNSGKVDSITVNLIAYINEGKIEFYKGQSTISTIDFGKVRLGTVSPPQTVTVVNSGTLKINIGDPSANSDSVIHRTPFLIPAGGQPPKATRLDEQTGSTMFTARFEPQPEDFGQQKGHYLIEAIQGGRFKRRPYDTLFAIGTGAVPNFGRKLDTVLVGQTAINTPVSRTVKEFWTNQPGGAIQLASLFRVDVESVEITALQPSTAAGEFSFTRQTPFGIDPNGTFDETFTFRPTSGAPLVHLALVRLVYDSVGNDNREMYFVLKGEVKAPEISALETVIDFGEVLVGATGTPVSPSSLLTNTGAVALNIYSPALADPNSPKIFTLTTAEFPSTVPVNAAMPPAGLRFTPDKEGEFTATLTMSTNAGGSGSTLTFQLKGKGILPGIQSSATEVDFGRVRVGRTAVDSLRLRNTAPNTQLQVQGFALSNPAEFTVADGTSLPLDLTNDYQSLPVTFTPQRPVGPRLDSVLINNTSQRDPAILLKGEAVLGAMEAFVPEEPATAVTDVDFGSVFVQQQESTSLELKNTGTFAYYLTRLELTGGDADQFSLSASSPGILLVGGYPDSYSLGVDESLLQAVSFFPTSEGEKTAVLRVIGLDPVSGLPEDTTFITLHGRATDLLLTSDTNTDTLDFGLVLAGTTAVNDGINDRYISFENPSKHTIPVSSIVLEGQPQDIALFTMSRSALSLAPAASDTVRVYFHPPAAMPAPVTVHALVTYTNGLQQRFAISGQGAAPSGQLDGVVYTADPALKTLAMTANIGASSTATVMLANSGNYDLLVSDLRWESPVDPWLAVDALPGFAPLTLAPGESHNFVFTFTPNASGVQTGRLVFTTNHIALGQTPDSSTFVLAVNAEGIYHAPPLSVTAVLPLNVETAPGAVVTLPLSIQSGALRQAGIETMSVVLTYDGTMLIPRSATAGPAAPGFTASFTETAAGRTQIILDGNGQTLDREGIVAYLSCEVLLGERTSTPLVLDTTQTVVSSLLPVQLSSVSGSVVLSEFCAADKRVIGVGGTVGLVLSSATADAVHFLIGTPVDDPLTLTIYDSYGRTIAVPVDAALPVGLHTVSVDTSTLAGGVYFAVLRVGSVMRTLRFAVQR